MKNEKSNKVSLIWKKAIGKVFKYGAIVLLLYAAGTFLMFLSPILGMIALFLLAMGASVFFWAYNIVAYLRAQEVEKELKEIRSLLKTKRAIL